ncbi:hypothetical protein IAR50_002036 [Cryptococcus sp. DSM 104548]
MPCSCADAARSPLYPDITTLHPLPPEVRNRIYHLLFREHDLCPAHVARLISFSEEFHLDNIAGLYKTVSLNDFKAERFFVGLKPTNYPPKPGVAPDLRAHPSYGLLYPLYPHYWSRKLALARSCQTLRFETPGAYISFLKVRHAWDRVSSQSASLRASFYGGEPGEDSEIFTSVIKLSLGPLLGLALYENPPFVLSQQAQYDTSLEPFTPQKICIHMPDPDLSTLELSPSDLEQDKVMIIDRPFDTFLGHLTRDKHMLTLHNARPQLHEYWLGKADRLQFDLAPQRNEREHLEVMVGWVRRYLRYCREPSSDEEEDDDSQDERPIDDVIISNATTSANLTAEELDEAMQSICQQYAGDRESPGVTVCGPQPGMVMKESYRRDDFTLFAQ